MPVHIIPMPLPGSNSFCCERGLVPLRRGICATNASVHYSGRQPQPSLRVRRHNAPHNAVIGVRGREARTRQSTHVPTTALAPCSSVFVRVRPCPSVSIRVRVWIRLWHSRPRLCPDLFSLSVHVVHSVHRVHFLTLVIRTPPNLYDESSPSAVSRQPRTLITSNRSPSNTICLVSSPSRRR